MLLLQKNGLKVEEILNSWYKDHKDFNYGAMVSFVGTIRKEDDIDGLSFDIYEPILKKWFNSWKKKVEEKNGKIYMAHSIGDVLVHQSSFIAAIFSPKRRVALEMIDEFVEDFKANAPIWKYDLKNSKRIYAKDRSTPMDNAGILVK